MHQAVKDYKAKEAEELKTIDKNDPDYDRLVYDIHSKYQSLISQKKQEAYAICSEQRKKIRQINP